MLKYRKESLSYNSLLIAILNICADATHSPNTGTVRVLVSQRQLYIFPYVDNSQL